MPTRFASSPNEQTREERMVCLAWDLASVSKCALCNAFANDILAMFRYRALPRRLLTMQSQFGA